MSPTFKSILAVIDPTTDQQRALERALGLAQAGGAAVHAYLCCYSNARVDDFAALERAETARHQLWLAQLAARYADLGKTFSFEVEWNHDWRESVARAAARQDCDLIVKSSFRHAPARRRILKTSDWWVLRHAHCPVLLVKQEHPLPLRCVLAAVDVRAEDDAHRQLNNAVMTHARQLAASADDCQLHAVSACEASQRVALRTRLATLTRLDIGRCHAQCATPEDAIVDCAALLDADLVIIGSVARSGLGALTSGNTAERALDNLDADLLVVTVRH